MTDQLHRFLFDHTPIRGELVQLGAAYREVLAIHHYPPVVGELLGQFMAAASLLAATIKFDGVLTLQARSEGEIPLIMAEASASQQLRAIARQSETALSRDFGRLLANGQLCITITPRQGKRYQGIVALEGDSLATCLEAYFRQSEQLATRLWLAADCERAAGFLLQELPARERDARQWEHVSRLAETLTADELLTLPADELLYRLYHEDGVRRLEARPVGFHCSCSRERVERTLLSLGREEVESVLAEQGRVEVNCEFCNRHYHLNVADVAALFDSEAPPRRH